MPNITSTNHVITYTNLPLYFTLYFCDLSSYKDDLPQMWVKRLLKNKNKHFRLTCVAQKRLWLSSLMIHLRPYLVPRSDNVLRFTEGDLGKNKMILEGEITDEKM